MAEAYFWDERLTRLYALWRERRGSGVAPRGMTRVHFITSRTAASICAVDGT